MAPPQDARLSFQEAMGLARVPPGLGSPNDVQRFMATRGAYLPGTELTGGMPRVHKATYGGHVYAQAGLAVCIAWKELENRKGVEPQNRFGLHTIHGYFTAPGVPDRPFIYDVTPTTTSRTFSTLSVTAYQATVPSTAPGGGAFSVADAALPLSPPSFMAMCSFKLRESHSAGISMQEDPPHKRFAAILGSRPPQEWPPSPPVDITAVVEAVGPNIVGDFPIVEMKKVDMTAFNEGKPVHERVELILYRLLKPLPADGTDGWDANTHMLVHAFTIDRNGLLMAGNHLGTGYSLSKAASLSYSFVAHTNADEAVMRYGESEWWVQEATFPRAGSGRVIVTSKVWSPEGVHVATEYQDGLLRSFAEAPERGKL